MQKLFLYHATSVKNKDSILKNGLTLSNPHNWDGMYLDDYLFLAVNPEVALDYVETSDTYSGEDVIVFKISLDDLDQSKIYYDWNNRCEYHDEINSVGYSENIPPDILHLMSPEEINEEDLFEIDDFQNTDMYERIMDTFYEQVGTNMETD